MGSILPFINFTLQNMEVFLHVEKRLFVMRGLINNPVVRDSTYTLSPANAAYVEQLCRHVLGVIDRLESKARV
jgi:hypothetical protein